MSKKGQCHNRIKAGYNLGPEEFDEIVRLLADGVSQRQVVIISGRTRPTISRIVRGLRRRPREPVEPEPEPELGKCDVCGAMVFIPCRSCKMRDRIVHGPPIKQLTTREDLPVFDLTSELEMRRREVLSGEFQPVYPRSPRL